ncbi:alanine--tRNA ligase-related protein [Microaerobacter geothermalis]|uniref:alanyl-tRNA editing protein n=1 Tax=Microaerobacter geothermalis TaxID=674972 RepID=UPI001F28EDD8|nr:alanine--tRNA ligase-related protein [Microaerobacter geothermalis]MCF6093536.1 alanine--tRNA ligase-related protein [Microaerobacter geothermalis]
MAFATKRIYEEDPYQSHFTANVLSQTRREDGHTELILDKTAFYPTGGGQPNDTGMIDGFEVIDVYKDGKSIVHLLKGNLEHKGTVEGHVNFSRRMDHMQQHCGQHILSAAFQELLSLETIGFHLGKEWVTVDLKASQINVDDVRKVELRANEIVMENRHIETRLMPVTEVDEQIRAKLPSMDGIVRLVEIDQFDLSACSGTHPYRTGEVGLIKIIGWEPYKGNVRLTFVCGLRAMRIARQFQDLLFEAAKLLRTNPYDVVPSLVRMKGEYEQYVRENRHLKESLIRQEAKQWIKQGEKISSVTLHLHQWINKPFQDMKELAKTIIEEPGHVVIFASEGQLNRLIAACSENISLSMRELVDHLLEMTQGRGGGSRIFAQLGFTAASVQDVLKFAKKWIMENL